VRTTGLLSQSPIVCPASLFRAPNPVEDACSLCTRTTPTTGAVHPSNPLGPADPHDAGRPRSRGAP
jgi:hypothetical protein